MVKGHTVVLVYEFARVNSPPVWQCVSYWPLDDTSEHYVRRVDYLPPMVGPGFTEVVPFEAALSEYHARLELLSHDQKR